MITSPLNGKRILVVDDEEDLRAALIYDFKRRGCIIFEASNGRDALAIVKSNPIDIVLSDVRMPNGDGLELLKQIRLYNPNIPIVALVTGFADIDEVTAIREGACALLEKPIDRKYLLAMLEKSMPSPK